MLAGFFRAPGDLGRWVSAGFEEFNASSRLAGPRTIIIPRRREHLPAKEVEDLLRRPPRHRRNRGHVGLPDDRTEEKARAVIVPCEGRAEAGRLPSARAAARSKGVAKFKAPEQCMVIWDALPKKRCGQRSSSHQIRAAAYSKGVDGSEMRVAIVTGATSGIGLGCARETRHEDRGWPSSAPAATRIAWPSWKSPLATRRGSRPWPSI